MNLTKLPAAAAEAASVAPTEPVEPVEPAKADAAVRASRALAVASLLALIVLGLAWELKLAPTGSGSLAFKVLPLVLPLAGLLRYRMVTYRATSLLVWLYFTEGAVRAASETGLSQSLAIAEIVLSLVLFAACTWHIRWRLAKGKS